MTATERRAEIMKVLTARRQETMGQLAFELGVTDRTIRTDITVLTADYPLDTVRGNGGCVKLAEWYRPQKELLTAKQETALLSLLDKADETEHQALCELLAAFGSPLVKEKFLMGGLAY